MYKKKNRMPMFLAVIAVILVMVIVVAVPILRSQKREQQAAFQEETEEVKYDAILYKTNGASIEFDRSYLKNDGETETILSIKPGELVTFLVTPKSGQILESVEIVDFAFSPVKFFQSESPDEGAVRVNFVMPEKEVIITLHLAADEPETELSPDPVMETETESETEASNPYGLTLHGVTADIITSYNGLFDDQKFMQAIGDALHIGSARSDYKDVTDVTFSLQEYTGEQDTDKVYHYVYLNDDPTWKVLSTYYIKEDDYIFTIPAEEETEEETGSVPASGENGSGSGGTTSSMTTGSVSGAAGSYTGGGQTTTTVTTSFDIMQVSTTFLSFVGDQETFYQKAFDYVLSKNLTGTIVGTMKSYEIDPEKQTADFQITLSTGGSISGTYDKKKDRYSFSGL